jgi:hypothetical protein
MRLRRWEVDLCAPSSRSSSSGDLKLAPPGFMKGSTSAEKEKEDPRISGQNADKVKEVKQRVRS